MNRLFLLLPTTNEDASYIHPYLRNYCPKDNEEINLFIKQLFGALKIIDHETYTGYLDNGLLASFYRLIKQEDSSTAILLMEYLNDWEDYHDMEEYTPTKINVNGIDIKNDILDSCRQCEQNGTTVINTHALNSDPKAIKVLDENNNPIRFYFLACNERDLYEWFMENRTPQRVLDRNYKKHSIFTKEGYRGTISPLTYDYETASTFLYKAVSGKGENKRLCYWVKDEHKILIFFNENLQESPTYHAYEITDNQQKELAKLSTSTKKKMEKVISLKR